jgi:hypothetical protein
MARGYLVSKGGTYPAQLKYKMPADIACQRITDGITRKFVGQRPIMAVLDPYNPTGSAIHVNFNTSKTDRWETDAREAGDADFDVLIACAFNYEARATEFSQLGRIPVLKARMNADLHMAEDLKNTGKGPRSSWMYPRPSESR